ncbi:SusC/RagA family TonB-linked outer membrane protein [Chitinophaga silvatica]|uniref:SusC/RagA family TonB-linked outer membrane protein n=1 Tax=Chitinophaga silvatica TaxID=2282649 RepID=A0A3E1Y243_9BACT|nr:SusC/RagA family TonB-linked outer membrane protein [Chitinophaga silvatica]RFS18760.1 SusC/RagA family TonB-linked outer membrane protein [Chitinophaga silvatica]
MLKTAICRQFFHALSSSQVIYSDQPGRRSRPAVRMFRLPTRILRVKSALSFIIFAACLCIPIASIAQNVSISGKGLTLKQVFSAIEKQTGYVFLTNKGALDGAQTVSLTVNNLPLRKLLDIALKDQPLEYVIQDKTIIISRKTPDGSSKNPLQAATSITSISGTVRDMDGKALEGASVRLKGINRGTTTDASGTFTLRNIDDNATIIISSLGYGVLSVPIPLLSSTANGDVIRLEKGRILKKSTVDFIFSLQNEKKQLDEVTVSTGMFDRNKETFTGLTKSYSGKDIRTASRTNVLEALSLLDPSFKVIRDNNLGSDPNQAPKVELRGSRTAPPPTPQKYSQQLKMQYEADPNQPLFILDGFEASLNTIVNLDINRIASITLLKDAASTALYGSRSANGVVVIQTLRPAPGKLMVSYSGTGTLTMPDLSGYNMMSAQELLKFQELASQGTNAPGPFAVSSTNQVLPGIKYAFRKNAVLQGVNSDWMNVPLQNSGVLNHNLSVTGGDIYFTYIAGISRNSTTGVMRGSDNSNTSGYLNLQYRTGKINVANNLTIAGNKQNGSPYGSFADYVNVPSYYVINSKDRYLESHDVSYYDPTSGSTVPNSFRYQNPLYNATLPSKNTVSGLSITNNIMANWDIFPFLRLSGNFQYNKTTGETDYFISPLNTQFDNTEANLKGSYNYNKSGTEAYNGNFTITYNKVFATKHILNANIRSGFSQTTDNRLGLTAVGFSATSEPLIYLANSFQPDARPGGSTLKKTSMELIGSVNYSYDMKYNLDLSYNMSGASSFGVDNPYKSFYAAGIGWNLGKENFLKHSKWVDQLYLTANLGLTGNQNAGSFGSRTTYILNNTPVFFGESTTLKGIGNPNLNWTKTYNLSYNLSGKFFNNILSTTLSGYRNLTDPLIMAIPVPPSLGITDGIPKNIGKITTVGFEVTIDARVINTRNWTLNLSFNSPVYYKSRYSALGDVLSKFNDSARNNGYMQRYYDGSSPDDVWAVRSLGVGQTRGFEVFLDKNGKSTFLFDKNNEVVVGSSRPVTQGNFNVRLRYKKFTIAVYSQYIISEMKFNDALYNKVENISAAGMENNQDKRALYVRWKNPGDDASFLGITNLSTGMSSRFLQKENALNVSNITFNYDILDQYSKGVKSYIRKKLGLQAFGFALSTSNIFQFKLSNIQRERGLNYPFARSVTLNLNATF